MRIGDREFPGFAPRFPWWGADLQTVRNALFAPPRLDGAGEALAFPTGDGTGDALSGRLHRPRAPSGRPLAVLIHGLTGCADSAYVRASAAFFLARGHPVLRLNLRGAGPLRSRCRERYHAGRSADLRAALRALPPRLAERGAFLMGYSLGGNVMLKTLGEPGVPEHVGAAVSVSAPIDLAATWRRFSRPRNVLYRRWLLARMKEETLAAPSLEPAARAAVAAARTIREFDDVYVAPRNGFAGAEDYWARCSALRFVAGIAAPTLLLTADDDPWIPSAPYRAHDWRRAPACRVIVARRGGHVGFHGRGARAAWHDRCAALFVERVYGAASRSAASSAK